MKNKHDLIIVGAGPAGLTAAIYAARYNLEFIMIGKLPGGEISEAHRVCNFPSQNNIGGFELAQEMINHAKELNVQIVQENVVSIEKKKDFLIKTDKEIYTAKKIIIATGRTKQKLNVPGEEEFLGNGVSYCATCDAPFYKGKEVAVIGGGDAALTAALLLAEHAKKVHVVYRKDRFSKAEPAWVDHVNRNSKISTRFNSEVSEIQGKDRVERIKLKDGSMMDLGGVFIEIGSVPESSIFDKLALNSENGYIITDRKQRTNVSGVFAAGDITNNHLKQVITASGEGAVAAYSVYEELMQNGN